MTTINVNDNDLAARSAQFSGTMELLAAFITNEINTTTRSKVEWRFDLIDSDFRRHPEWKVYGFLSFSVPDGRNSTIVAGVSDPSPYRYAFDGSRDVLLENIEFGDLPKVADDLVDDLIAELGLTKRPRF